MKALLENGRNLNHLRDARCLSMVTHLISKEPLSKGTLAFMEDLQRWYEKRGFFTQRQRESIRKVFGEFRDRKNI